MRKLLPYSMPMLFSLLFVGTAHTNWLWLTAFFVFLAGRLTPLVGEFSVRGVVAEYDFFHYSPLMARFKTMNGFFFVLLNGWAFFFLALAPLPFWRLVVFVYTLIILNSNFAISLAHDLMHSRYRIDRWLSGTLLIQNGFFYLEADHIHIHHRHVGTRHDPATARFNEPIYSYLIRSLTGRMRILFNRSDSFSGPKGWANFQPTSLKLGLCGLYLAGGALAGGQVLGWLLAQYVVVILIYESITYIQHYALYRLAKENRYEPVQLHHAWNSFYRLNAYLYFMMPVHSLHHAHHPDLTRIRDAGPRMPLPFARMLLTAYQPARWFALMNSRAAEHRSNSQSTPANHVGI